MRVEHKRDGSNSSYSSLHSDWQTIKSEDEQVRSFSIIGKDAPPTAGQQMHDDNPFTVKEEPKEEASKSDMSPHLVEERRPKDEEESDK